MQIILTEQEYKELQEKTIDKATSGDLADALAQACSKLGTPKASFKINILTRSNTGHYSPNRFELYKITVERVEDKKCQR